MAKNQKSFRRACILLAVVMAVTGTAYSHPVPNRQKAITDLDPVAYWPLNEKQIERGVRDRTQNHHDGFYQGLEAGDPGSLPGGRAASFFGIPSINLNAHDGRDPGRRRPDHHRLDQDYLQGWAGDRRDGLSRRCAGLQRRYVLRLRNCGRHGIQQRLLSLRWKQWNQLHRRRMAHGGGRVRRARQSEDLRGRDPRQHDDHDLRDERPGELHWTIEPRPGCELCRILRKTLPWVHRRRCRFRLRAVGRGDRNARGPELGGCRDGQPGCRPGNQRRWSSKTSSLQSGIGSTVIASEKGGSPRAPD